MTIPESEVLNTDRSEGDERTSGIHSGCDAAPIGYAEVVDERVIGITDDNSVCESIVEPGSPQPSLGTPIYGAVIGTLIGFKDGGCTPLVLFPGQLSPAAVPAGAIVDLHGMHIGRHVVLLLENGDPRRPIIMGLLRTSPLHPFAETPGLVEVARDGERVIITAKEQLVLRCGKATITLTQAGKVIIRGAYLSSHSSGVMRLKGGSVQIN